MPCGGEAEAGSVRAVQPDPDGGSARAHSQLTLHRHLMQEMSLVFAI
jgi:hypothetical protein